MQNNLFALFTEPFTRAGIEYIITGSVAAIVYGDPRLTNDIDVVVNLRPADINRLSQVFLPDQYYLPPPEVLQTENQRSSSGHFTIIHRETMFKCDVYCAGDDSLHEWAFNNKRIIDFLDATIAIAPPEYVIIRKLEFYQESASPKHLSDIEAILKNSADIIDHSFLKNQIRTRKLNRSWEQIGIDLSPDY